MRELVESGRSLLATEVLLLLLAFIYRSGKNSL